MKKFSLTPKKTKRSDTPKYMSDTGVEYTIVLSPSGMWRIAMYKGGFTPKPLRGLFTQKSLAEKALISWIKRRNKFREAIYPGCPDNKLANSTGRS